MMDERMRFVARLLEGEKMAVLCREFDISRKTGYKLFSRFKNCGIKGQGWLRLLRQISFWDKWVWLCGW
jgi:transposase